MSEILSRENHEKGDILPRRVVEALQKLAMTPEGDKLRFELDHGNGYLPAASMEQDDYGDWVRHDVYIMDVAALAQSHLALLEENARLKQVLDDMGEEIDRHRQKANAKSAKAINGEILAKYVKYCDEVRKAHLASKSQEPSA